MKTNKIIALGLTLAMAFTLSACGSAFNSTTGKIAKVLDKAKYEKIDEKDYDDDDMEDYAEDGFYVTLKDSKNLKSLAKSFDFDKDDVKAVFAGAKMDDGNMIMTMVYEFNDKDTAEDFYDDMVDELKDEVKDFKEEDDDDSKVETNKGDNFYQFGYQFDWSDWDIYMESYADVRIDGTTVTVITVTASEKKADVIDDLNDICEALKIDSPADLI